MKKRDVIFTIIGIVLVSFVLFRSKANQRAKSINCTFNISAICFATSLWADDANQGMQPRTITDLIACSNEICTTKVLICPADSQKQAAVNFSSLVTNNLSYELIGQSVRTQDTNNPFLRCEIHKHLGYSLGLVFDGKHKFIPAIEAHGK
jgi:hypothetical protein